MSDTLTEATRAEPSAPERQLFISHRHADRRIADVIRKWVGANSGGRVRVFQSSAAAAVGPRIGESLNEELARNLAKADVVILVYTADDHDWQYCVYECGLATKLNSHGRIIVFQCGSRPPRIFIDRVRVNVRVSDDVQRFANDFLTSPEFFRNDRGPIAPGFNPNDDNVRSAAKALYNDLQKELPPTEEDRVEEWPPYPYLRLELSREQVEAINRQPNLGTALDAVLDARLIEGDGEAARIFGRRVVPAAQFRVLVDGWTRLFQSSSTNWLEGLAEQVIPVAQDSFPTLRWELMHGMDREDGTLYAPVINRVRKIHATQCVEIDIYFDKFAIDDETGFVRVGVPAGIPTPTKPMPEPEDESS